MSLYGGFIRGQTVTSAAAPDGQQLKYLVTTQNTSGSVWADSAYGSESNEKWLAQKMLVSRIHRKKPKGKPMPKASARANARKSAIRARIKHVFAHQKNRFGLFIGTIGIKRAEAKLTLAHLANTMDRLIFHEHRAATQRVRPKYQFCVNNHLIRSIRMEKIAAIFSKRHDLPRRLINYGLIPMFRYSSRENIHSLSKGYFLVSTH